jgi:hypothetical protein
MEFQRRDLLKGAAMGLGGLALQPISSAFAQAPSWLAPDLLAAAKAEGGEIIVYGSMNEQEALPLWKAFESATGIRVQFVRSSDTGLMSRIVLEARAAKILGPCGHDRGEQTPAGFLASARSSRGQKYRPQCH